MDSEKLLCLEVEERCNLSAFDPAIMCEPKVLDKLLDLEPTYAIPYNYFKYQTDIKSFMRKVVVSWMLEVCEEQGCEDPVFPLAVNFLDRFLCVQDVHRNKLQLVGGVCLLIASKLRQCRSLTISLICYFTDYSVDEESVKQWEALVLAKLKWDVAGITGFDFVDHLLTRLPKPYQPHSQMIRRHALTFLSLCLIEIDFMQVPASVIGACVLSVAVRRLAPTTLDKMSELLGPLIRTVPKSLSPYLRRVDLLVSENLSSVQQQTSNTKPGSLPHTKHATSTDSQEATNLQETPTDVLDVHL